MSDVMGDKRRPSWPSVLPQLFAILAAVALVALVAPVAGNAAGSHDEGLGDGFTHVDNSLHDQPISDVILAVGRMLHCNTAGLSLEQLQVLSASEVAADALVNATASVQVDCSLQLSTGSPASGDAGPNDMRGIWQPGPVQQQQQVLVSGLRALDCVVHSDQLATGDTFPTYIFVLVVRGQQQEFQAVEYAQIMQGGSELAAVEGWLDTRLPGSCLASLQMPSGSSAGQKQHDSMPTYDVTMTTRRLQQATQGLTNTTNTTTPSAANATDAATANSSAPSPGQPTNPQGQQPNQQPGMQNPAPPAADPATALPATSSQTPADAVQPSPAPKPAATKAGKSRNNTEQVIVQDQRLTDAANSSSNGNMSAVPTICTLPAETGPCRAAIPRWAFDMAAGACKEFVYGGCDGNANNFEAQAACEAACLGTASGIPPAEPPTGPLATTVGTPRVLARGDSPAPAPSTSTARDWSRAERLLRVALAGAVAGLTVLLL